MLEPRRVRASKSVSAKTSLTGDTKFLTPEEVSARYRGEITFGTLRNWRALRIGPPFVKIGKAVLYPIDGLDAWDRANTVGCDMETSLAETDSPERS